MAVLHKLWMLKASLRSTSAYKGEFLLGGLIQYFFYKEAYGPLIASPEVSGSVTATVGHSQSCRSLGSSFTEVFSCSRILAANHKPSTMSSIQLQTLLSTEALSHVFSTSTINCPSLQNFRYTSVKVATKLRGSNLGKHSEAGLYVLPGPTQGVLSQKERTIVPNQGIGKKKSELRTWNEHGWCNKQTQMDRDGVAYVEACKYKSKAITSVDSCSLVIQGIDDLLEANEDFDVEECALDGHIHEQNMILEIVSMQCCLNVQSVSSLSIGRYPFDPVSLVSGVEDSHGSFAGEESSGLEFSGCHELRYAEVLSRNLDK